MSILSLNLIFFEQTAISKRLSKIKKEKKKKKKNKKTKKKKKKKKKTTSEKSQQLGQEMNQAIVVVSFLRLGGESEDLILVYNLKHTMPSYMMKKMLHYSLFIWKDEIIPSEKLVNTYGNISS